MRSLRALLVAAVAGAAALVATPASATPPDLFTYQRALVLQASWPGSAALPTDLDSNLTGPVSTYMKTVSRGMFPGFTVDDPGAITVAQPADAGDCDTNRGAMVAALRAQARAHGIEPDGDPVTIYWYPPLAHCTASSGDLDGRSVYLNGETGLYALVHELGHHFGLGHAHLLSCDDGNHHTVTLSTSCGSVEYGDFFSAMGYNTGSYNAIELDHLGWLNGLIADPPTGGGSYVIAPIDAADGGYLRAVRIHDGDQTLWVEYRQPNAATDPSSYQNGVLVHLEKPDGLVQDGSFLLQMAPTQTSSQMLVGVPWTDPLGHAVITVDWAVAKAAHITVGTTLRQVPNIMGSDATTAATILAGQTLVLGTKSTVNNCVDTGSVQLQNPQPGTWVEPGSAVAYTLSTCTRTNPGGGGGGGGTHPK